MVSKNMFPELPPSERAELVEKLVREHIQKSGNPDFTIEWLIWVAVDSDPRKASVERDSVVW